MRARRDTGTAVSGLAITAVAAVALGGLALWNVRRARAAERAHPAPGRFVTVAGVRLHYVERGSGRPVVLIHGNVVTAADFAQSGVIDRLVAQGYRVVAFDRPGYGHSERPRGAWTASDQATVLALACGALGLERPIVVGHSYGTLVALALALDHPAVPSGLVLVSGYYYPTLRADVAMASVVALPIVGDFLRYTVLPPLGRLTLPLAFAAMFGPRPVPPALARGFTPAFALRPVQLKAENGDGATMVHTVTDLEARYGALHLPVFILAGAKDRVVAPDGQADRLHGAIAHSRLSVLPDVGHMLHHADPDLVATAVAWAAETPLETGVSTVQPPARGAEAHGAAMTPASDD